MRREKLCHDIADHVVPCQASEWRGYQLWEPTKVTE
jgi:hypothetical protein